MTTVSDSGKYRLPAEWEKQEAVWFAWPTRAALWEGKLDLVQDQLAQLYALAAGFQRVCVLCSKEAQSGLRKRLAGADVELFDYSCDDVWCRDFGPLFMINETASELHISDWRFNAWGEKYAPWSKDDGAAAWIGRELCLAVSKEEQVLEGGAIECNGAGVLLTTEAVLLNPNRGAMGVKAAAEERLSAGLGISQVLWLGQGLASDDTDGHIDNLARFYREDAILYAAAPDRAHPDYTALADNERRIQSFTTVDGRPYQMKALPLPAPIYEKGEMLAASYLNYLVLNGAVLVPTYGQPDLEGEVLRIIGECYPGREILGFDCLEIIREGGALHCLSQHQPALA